MLTTLPIVISMLAMFFTGANYVRAERKDARDAVWEYLVLLTSEQVVKVREVVSEGARSNGPVRRHGSYGEYFASDDHDRAEKYRNAIFQMMWIVQLSAPIVRRYVKGKNVATPEAVEVYAHLNLVLPDLKGALDKWGGFFDWRETGLRTNANLDKLPRVKNAFEISVSKLTEVRLPVPEIDSTRFD